MDEAALERAARRYRLVLPRAAMTGRLGSLSANQAGSSLDLHDFREYQPGDDPRHIDWNAVGRTDRLILRVRREEVSPRAEILIDGSRSMALSKEKEARTRELATLFARLAKAQSLSPAVHWLADAPRRVDGPLPDAFTAVSSLPDTLRRVNLRPCGLRILISDLLVEAPLAQTLRRLADGAALLALVQVLDPEDEEPQGDLGARLVDSETDEALDRTLTEDVVARYRTRLKAHQASIQGEARRLRAMFVTVSAGESLETSLRGRLSGKLLEPRAAS